MKAPSSNHWSHPGIPWWGLEVWSPGWRSSLDQKQAVLNRRAGHRAHRVLTLRAPLGWGTFLPSPVSSHSGGTAPSANPEDGVMLGGALTLSPCVSGGSEWGSASSFREAARPLARIDGKLQGSKPSFLCTWVHFFHLHPLLDSRG